MAAGREQLDPFHDGVVLVARLVAGG